MASVTKPSEEKKAMADEGLTAAGAELPEEREEAEKVSLPAPSASKTSAKGGFFSIYKKGQGYWTRMGTAIGGGMVIAFTAYNLYKYVPTFLPSSLTEGAAQKIGLAVSLVFLVSATLLGFWLTNKATNVDFLIATDSEMKKVNWTSRRELIGSTKVVILFMFVITLFLFVVDILFGYLFYVMKVLQNGPFGGGA